MPTIDVYNTSREKVSELELDEAVFGVEVREHLMHAAVRYQLAKRRQGTHSVKSRSEVRGGGKKPWRQKGTGRARQGTIRAPQWRGGGAVHGPRTERNYTIKLNKKVRRAALASALSHRIAEGSVVVLDDMTFPEVKSKQVREFLKRFDLKNALIVLGGSNPNVELSARNFQELTVLRPEGVNVLDVLKRDTLVLTTSAAQALVERLRS